MNWAANSLQGLCRETAIVVESLSTDHNVYAVAETDPVLANWINANQPTNGEFQHIVYSPEDTVCCTVGTIKSGWLNWKLGRRIRCVRMTLRSNMQE